MFNYDDLQVTLTVTPEISPSDFYRKEEADKLFVKDVEDKYSVYGRKKGQWVQFGQDWYQFLAGFLATNNFADFAVNEDYKNLNEIPFIASSTVVELSLANEQDGNTLWICFDGQISSIKTKLGLSVEFTHDGEIETGDNLYQVYSIKNLNKGEYDLLISL